LRLSLLAPDIVETVLDGAEPSGLSLKKLFRAPMEWEAQRQEHRFTQSRTRPECEALGPGSVYRLPMAAARGYFFSPFANAGPGTNSPVPERVTSPRLSKNVRKPPALLGPNPVFLLISVI